MDLNSYSKTMMQLVPATMSAQEHLIHATLGIAGETGEVVELIKKNFAYGKDLDLTKITLELGDLIFYINYLIVKLDLTWGQVLDGNFRKLSARYPNMAFSTDLAINRDTQAEAEAMKG